MKYDLKYFSDYLTRDEETRFDVDKNMLKVLMVNQDSDDALFNYYNFTHFKEVISFIKLVILPTGTLSTMLSEYEKIMQVTMDKVDLLEYMQQFKEEENYKVLIDKYNTFYSRLDELEKNNISIRDMIKLTEEMNIAYDGENTVFLILEFSDCLKTYLSDIYEGYKRINDDFESLEERLSETDFSLEDLVELKNNSRYMQQDDLEEFLYQIPII